MRRHLVRILLVVLCFGMAVSAQETRPSGDGPERELRDGIALTSRGEFQQAIPHFLAARGGVADSFALEFNLALCYVGTRQFPEAIGILSKIGGRRANVKNLLAQAYLGARRPDAALKAFLEGVEIEPQSERLYLQVAQACLDESNYDVGARVLDIGLEHLPGSARLHFERGVLHAQQDDNESADRDFQAARRLAPGSETALIAAAEQAFIAGDVESVIRAAREGIRAGHAHYLLFTMLGEAVLRSGALPATPEFNEARAALEQAVAAQPRYSSSHIALGRVYLMLDQVPEAIRQLETGRRLDPRNRSLYQPLATAYRRSGEPGKVREALAALAELNRQEAERIRSAEGGHSGYLSGRPSPDKKPPQ